MRIAWHPPFDVVKVVPDSHGRAAGAQIPARLIPEQDELWRAPRHRWQRRPERAERSAAVTHDDPEGIRGAQATAAAVFYARQSRDKDWIRDTLELQFGYNLSFTLDDIRPDYNYDVTCQGTVPQALVAFFEASSYEDAIRNAISLGGDADTLACITGGVAEAYYGGLPPELESQVLARLDPGLAGVVGRFRERFRPT